MIKSGLTLIMILLVYFISKDIIITIVGSIAVILIVKSLEPFLIMFERKIFPTIPIKNMRKSNMSDEPGKGVRIILVTQFTEFDSDNKQSVELYDKIVSEAVEKLKETKPVFDLRYGVVTEKELPMQYSFAVCGEKGSGMRKCYNSWLKEINAKDFGAWKEGSELFLFDGVYNDPATNEVRSSIVMFMFDSRLPKTVRKPVNEQGETSKE